MIQAKTSLRERVRTDVEPSINAMKYGFWSVLVVLDGDNIKPTSKDQKVINGDVGTKKINSWNGAYVLSNITMNDRVYLDEQLELFVDHANRVKNTFISGTKITNNWRP